MHPQFPQLAKRSRPTGIQAPTRPAKEVSNVDQRQQQQLHEQRLHPRLDGNPKTDDIYGKMRDAMDSSNTRAHAEDKLNEIKAKILECKTSDAAPEEVRELINQAIEDYKDVPEVAQVLGDFAKNLNDQSEATSAAAERARNELKTLTDRHIREEATSNQTLIQRIRTTATRRSTKGDRHRR